MDPIKLGQVSNADVYLVSAGAILTLTGRVKEFTLEGVSYKTIEHAALGMIAQVDLPGRMLEPLKGKLTFEWLDEAVMRKTAFPNRAVSLQFQKYVDVFDSSGLVKDQGHRLITSVDLMFQSSTIDALKAGEGVGEELEAAVTRLRVTTSKSTVPIREISVFDNINRADGEDVWPTY